MRQRQVALAGFQRDRGGHDAGEAVDVAAHDHHGADLRDGAAEAGDQHREQRIALVPGQQQAAQQRPRAQRSELLAVARSASSTAWRVSAVATGSTSTACASTMALNENSQPRNPSGPERDSSR